MRRNRRSLDHQPFQADINADPDDGSAVSFENGGHQVSYEKEQA